MQIMEIDRNPPRSHVVVFGALFAAFFALVGALARYKPHALLFAAILMAAAWILSLIFNSKDRTAQLLGILMPAIFAASGGAVVRGVDPTGGVAVASVVCGVCALGAILVWTWPEAGRQIYVYWMVAVVPIGWTISHLLLAVVYYLVLTPIGLIMQLSGYDPMRRKPDRSMNTYWIEHEAVKSIDRYFRQY